MLPIDPNELRALCKDEASYQRALTLFEQACGEHAAADPSGRALRRSEMSFQAIFNSMYQFIGLMEPDGTMLEANETALAFGGLTPEDVIGKPFWECRWWTISPETQVFLQDAIHQAATGEFVRYEVEVKGAGDATTVIDFSIKPVFNEEGEVTLLIPEGRDVSEKIEAARALRESEARNRAILDALPDLIFRLDRDGVYLDYRAHDQSDLVIEADQIIGTNIAAMLPEALAERALGAVHAALDTQQVVSLEYELQTLDGALKHYEARISPSNPDEVLVVVRDVTQQKRSAAALAASEERLELALRGADLGLWDWNIETGDVAFNERWAHMLGYELDEVEHNVSSWERLVHPEDMPHVTEVLTEHMEGKRPLYETEHRMLAKDGSWRWILDRGCVVERAADGTPIRAAGTHLDITERKEAAQKLAERKAYLRAIIENTEDLIWSVDPEFRLLTCNAPFIKSLEASYGVVLEEGGSILFEGLPQEEAERWKGWYARVLAGEHLTIDQTNEIGGVRYDFEISLRPIVNDRGRVTGIVGMGHDVTEHRRVERMKNEFVSTVSHELRTPLTSIRGSLGLVAGGLAGALPEKAGQLIEIAHRSSERLVLLINDILDLQKIEAGEMAFTTQLHDLMPIIERSIEDNAAYAAQLGVTLELGATQTEAQVYVDEMRLQQVMANLLSNAAKFSPSGERVTVRVKQHGHRVRVEVQDRGPGIPEAFRKRIFSKFAQADSSDTKEKSGTGLGLSISKALVERMGGRIGFETSEGKGTCFYFELSEHRHQAEGVAAPEGTNQPTILVCEDDPHFAHLLAMVLKEEGFIVDIAADAAQVRAKVEERHYDALTLDLNLSNADGLALMHELRADGSLHDLPIIVVSVTDRDARPDDDSSALNLADWYCKPVEVDDLVASVCTAVAPLADRTPRILHVEDDVNIRQTVASVLGRIADVTCAPTMNVAEARLADEHFDLVLLDLGLPDGDGTALLRYLGEHAKNPVPVVVFSAQEAGEEMARRVAGTLLKSRASNNDLLRVIRSTLASVPTKLAS